MRPHRLLAEAEQCSQLASAFVGKPEERFLLRAARFYRERASELAAQEGCR